MLEIVVIFRQGFEGKKFFISLSLSFLWEKKETLVFIFAIYYPLKFTSPIMRVGFVWKEIEFRKSFISKVSLWIDLRVMTEAMGFNIVAISFYILTKVIKPLNLHYDPQELWLFFGSFVPLKLLSHFIIQWVKLCDQVVVIIFVNLNLKHLWIDFNQNYHLFILFLLSLKTIFYFSEDFLLGFVTFASSFIIIVVSFDEFIVILIQKFFSLDFLTNIFLKIILFIFLYSIYFYSD